MKKYTKKNVTVTAAVSGIASAAVALAVAGSASGSFASSVYNCDVNGDGTVNVVDLNVIKNVVLNHYEDQNTEKKTAGESVSTPGYVFAYSDLIDYYYKAFTTFDVKIQDFGYNWLAPKARPDSAIKVDSVGYSLKDLNGDGTPELIIGTMGKDNKGSELGVVYSYVAKQDGTTGLVNVLESWDRSHNTLAEDGSILYYGSGGAAYAILSNYTLGEKDPREFKYISHIFSEPNAAGDGVVYYYNTDGVSVKENSKVLTKEEFDKFYNELSEQRGKATDTINFTPLSEYKNTDDVFVHFGTEDDKTDLTEYCDAFGDFTRNTVFTAREDVTHFTISKHIFRTDESGDTGRHLYVPFYSAAKLEAGHAIAAGLDYPGDTSYYTVSFVDNSGVLRYYNVGISGKDGSVVMTEDR